MRGEFPIVSGGRNVRTVEVYIEAVPRRSMCQRQRGTCCRGGNSEEDLSGERPTKPLEALGRDTEAVPSLFEESLSVARREKWVTRLEVEAE